MTDTKNMIIFYFFAWVFFALANVILDANPLFFMTVPVAFLLGWNIPAYIKEVRSISLD